MTTAAKKTRTSMLAAGLVLSALLAIAIGTLYWPRPSNDEATRAASNIARQCAGGQRIENAAKIESGLGAYLTKVSARAMVTSQDVGVVTSMLKPDGVSLDIYKIYTQCLKDQTEAYLKLKGVNILPQQPAFTGKDAENTLTLTPTASDGDGQEVQLLTGYIYYEENDGHTTEDGVFEPYPKALLPRYERLTPGMVLRTVRAAEVRDGPTGSDSPADTPLTARQCVRVLDKPEHPPSAPLKRATSGGRIRVQTISCPQRPERTTADVSASARPRVAPVARDSAVMSVNQSGGITAGQIGELNVGSKP